MKSRNFYKGLLSLVAGTILVVGVAAYAQEAEKSEGNRSGEQRRGRGGFRNMSAEERQKFMEEFRKKMNERIREQLGFTEEEWKVIQPLYEKITRLMREQSMGARMGGGPRMGAGGTRTRPDGEQNANRNRRGGPEGEKGQREQSELAKARTALQTVLNNKASTAEQVKTALLAYRAAKAKLAKELATARASLKELLTPRQEAQFAMMGVLE